jgi:hypothetical protein
MKTILLGMLLGMLVCSCNNAKIGPPSMPSKYECAITNKELIAWIYKNRMINEQLNNYPENKVSVVVFTNLKKQYHFLKGIQPNDTIIDLCTYGKIQNKMQGYKGITTLLDDTIMIFDSEDIGEKYYDKLLLKDYPMNKIPFAKGKTVMNRIVFAVYNLYPEKGTLKLWNK